MYTYKVKSSQKTCFMLIFCRKLCAQKSNEVHTKQAKIMGVHYFHVYQQMMLTSYFILYPIFILLSHCLRQFPFMCPSLSSPE